MRITTRQKLTRIASILKHVKKNEDVDWNKWDDNLLWDVEEDIKTVNKITNDNYRLKKK